MPRPARGVMAGLAKKGFSKKENDHTFFHLSVDGKKTRINKANTYRQITKADFADVKEAAKNNWREPSLPQVVGDFLFAVAVEPRDWSRASSSFKSRLAKSQNLPSSSGYFFLGFGALCGTIPAIRRVMTYASSVNGQSTSSRNCFLLRLSCRGNACRRRMAADRVRRRHDPGQPGDLRRIVSKTIPGAEPVPFITLAELEKSMQAHIESIDLSQIVNESISRMQGRV